jgi:predicted ATP-grasp superfamily ATP-dependent carboligase
MEVTRNKVIKSSVRIFYFKDTTLFFLAAHFNITPTIFISLYYFLGVLN